MLASDSASLSSTSFLPCLGSHMHLAWQQGIERRWWLWWALNKTPEPLQCLLPTHFGGYCPHQAPQGWQRVVKCPPSPALPAWPHARWLQPSQGTAVCHCGPVNVRAEHSTIVWNGKNDFVMVTQHGGSWSSRNIFFLPRMNEFSQCPINNMETNENLWSHKAQLVSPGQVSKVAGCNTATFWPTAEKV